MNYIEVPVNIEKIKTKIIFNLTKRQLICFLLAGLVSVPSYLLMYKKLGITTSIYVMTMLAIPFFILAFYEKDGKGAEKHFFYFFNYKLMKKIRKKAGEKIDKK